MATMTSITFYTPTGYVHLDYNVVKHGRGNVRVVTEEPAQEQIVTIAEVKPIILEKIAPAYGLHAPSHDAIRWLSAL